LSRKTLHKLQQNNVCRLPSLSTNYIEEGGGDTLWFNLESQIIYTRSYKKLYSYYIVCN